ncbi:MAG: acetoacetate metabolism transcriptional regulator AtoC [Terriglobales bacterium]
MEALRLGARDHLLKPIREAQLESMLGRHIAGRNLEHDVTAMSEDIHEINDELSFVAASPAMRKLRAQAELLAKVNVPVLILGESGSGKEVAARLIHKLSVRSSCRFLKVNCAALPGDLLESELFGYERGAFTGAMRTKPGKFELCDKGTILLDEIAEMPVGLQAKLLHVLQDKQFSRLGGETTINVDVRILAATNVNIEQALAEKRLREDLYYRLSAFTVQVPPLRDRRDEIPLLLGHFMSRMAKHYSLPVRSFATLVDACQRYLWPGNLRELENFVKRYLVMGDESAALDELEPKIKAHVNELRLVSSDKAIPAAHMEISHDDSVLGGEDRGSLKTLVKSAKDETERNAIVNMLEQTQWNRKEAARQLQISYRGLLYKIQEYQLTPPGAFFSSPLRAIDGKGHGHSR